MMSGRSDKLRHVFQKFDSNSDGSICQSELQAVLRALGVETDDIGAFFNHIDVNQDGKLTYDEFVDWLYEPSGEFAVDRSKLEGASLEEVFRAYCGRKPDMEGKQFTKLCKDSGLIKGNFTATEADIVFTKAKSKGQRRIPFYQFEDAVRLIAEKKGVAVPVIVDIITGSGAAEGPVLSGTQADDVRFHDDRNSYTGTHARGGPEAVASGLANDSRAAQLLGLRSGPLREDGGQTLVPAPPSEPRSASKASSRRGSRTSNVVDPMLAAFAAAEAARRYERSSTAGTIEEAAGGSTPAAAAVQLTPVAPAPRREGEQRPPSRSGASRRTSRTSQRVDPQVVAAAAEAAQRKATTGTDLRMSDLEDASAAMKGPARDDEPATVRHVFSPHTERANSRTASQSSRVSGHVAPAAADFAQRRRDECLPTALSGAEEAAMECFRQYCGKDVEMDGKTFAKLCKDAGLLDKQMFTATDADLLFAKIVTKGMRRITEAQYREAWDIIAEKRSCHKDDVVKHFSKLEGPVLNGTVVGSVRLHDHLNGETRRMSGGTSSTRNSPRVSEFDRGSASPAARDMVATALAPSPRRDSRTSSRANSKSSRASGQFDARSVVAAMQMLQESQERDPVQMAIASFRRYCGSDLDLDGKTFAKLCRDADLLDRNFTLTDVDLLFARLVPKGMRRIGEAQFQASWRQIADKKGCPMDLVIQHVAVLGGPVHIGTNADYVRFHDDHSFRYAQPVARATREL